MAAELTSTSYAVLALLGVRPWSAYELNQQMSRSLSWYWPKAESLVYAECKKLAEHDLATSRQEPQGRRPRTVYTITDRGRDALRGWLDQPTAGPRLEWEAMLQVAFADHGSREQLLENLEAIRTDAEDRRDRALTQAASYAAAGGPFPERLPVVALVGKFFLEYSDLLVRWADWAEQNISNWNGLRPEDAPVPADVFEPGAWSTPGGDEQRRTSSAPVDITRN
jgi:PadR family transcriptional regulator, regulatory protein AphA